MSKMALKVKREEITEKEFVDWGIKKGYLKK